MSRFQRTSVQRTARCDAASLRRGTAHLAPLVGGRGSLHGKADVAGAVSLPQHLTAPAAGRGRDTAPPGPVVAAAWSAPHSLPIRASPRASHSNGA